MKYFISIYMFSVISLAFSSTFDKSFGGNGSELSGCVKSTIDGGYIIAGSTTSIGNGGYDGYLIKTDSLGNTIWEKTYGSTSNDVFFDLQQTSDNGYIIVGSKNRADVLSSDGDFWLMKVDKNGKEKWNKSYEDSINGYIGSKVKITDDNGYIILGSTRTSLQSIICDVWVMKTDGSGNELWSKKYDSGSVERGTEFIRDANYPYEAYTILSNKSNGGGDYVSEWVFSINNTGTKIRENFIELNDYSGSSSIDQNSNGSFILSGTEYNEIPPFVLEPNIQVIKLNSNLSLAWNKTYQKNGNQYGKSTIKTSDGCYVLIGTSESENSLEDIILMKLDSTGNVIWERAYGSDLFEFATGNIFETGDNGFVATFTSKMTSLFAGGDISLIRTDNLGNVIYPPSITSFDNISNNISINWSVVPNAGSYIVYSSDRADSNYVPADTTSVNYWNSIEVDSLKKKFYYIKASTNGLK